MPEGVKLQEWSDFPGKRAAVFDAIKNSVAKKFPQSYGGVRLELHDLKYVDPEEYSLKDQKDALMSNKFLHRRLRGTYKLFDEKTGDLLEEREATVLRAPYLTERGTWVHGGSEYTTANQARLLPGVYTRRKSSGELESHFNTKRGTGSSFRVRLEPDTGLFKMDIGQSSLRLYSLLKDIGVSDGDLEAKWGPDLLKANRDKYDARVFEKAYARLVRKQVPGASREDKAKAIKDALAGSKLDGSVLARTLPNRMQKFAAVTPPVTLEPQEEEGPDIEKKEFNKQDYLLLAKILDDKFHAGIPLDVPTSELVADILKALQEVSGTQINPEVLGMAIDQYRPKAEEVPSAS